MIPAPEIPPRCPESNAPWTETLKPVVVLARNGADCIACAALSLSLFPWRRVRP